MKIRLKLLLSNLVVTLIAISLCVLFIFEIISVQNLVNQQIPSAMQNLSSASYFDSLAQLFKYNDEVLTMSARDYALTGDIKWKTRYNAVAEDLDAKIKEAIAKGDATERKFFAAVNESNNALMLQEKKSFKVVENGDKKAAIAVLDSKEYANLKAVYAEALTNYVNSRGQQYQQALVISTTTVQGVVKNIAATTSRMIRVFVLGVLVGLIVIFIFVWYFSKRFVAPLYDIKSGTQEIVKGNLDKRIDVKSRDEFENLADSFNIMAERLKENIEGVEKKIKDRTEELENLNRYMVGREMKMIELKKQISDLQKNNKN